MRMYLHMLQAHHRTAWVRVFYALQNYNPQAEPLLSKAPAEEHQQSRADFPGYCCRCYRLHTAVTANRPRRSYVAPIFYQLIDRYFTIETLLFFQLFMVV